MSKKFTIVEVNGNNKLKELYRVIKKAPSNNDFNVTIKDFIQYANLGKAYQFTDNGKVIGGLVLYHYPDKDVILSLYVPEKYGYNLMLREVCNIIFGFTDKYGRLPMFTRSSDIGTFSRFVKHIEDDYYQVILPNVRF